MSDLLSFGGILLTVFFGIWGVKVALSRRYPGKLTFVEENAIGLFNSIIKNFPEIKIQYDDLPISQQMVYLKASFINTGSIDLSTLNNAHKLKIKLSEGYKWINCKLTNQSKDIRCNLSIIENELVFDFDLLRKNEFIQFEAFAEIKNTIKPAYIFRKSLIFLHRIPNTSKVDKLPYLNENQISDKKFEFKKSMVFATIFLIASLSYGLYNVYNKSSKLIYVYNENNEKYQVISTSIGLNQIKIEDDNKDFIKTMSLNEFNSLTNLHAEIKDSTFFDLLKKMSLFIIYLVMYIFFTITEYRDIYKNKKVKRIIEGNE